MAKKPTKRRTAKRAKPKRIPRDPVTGQPLLFDPATGKATTGHRPMTDAEWREYSRKRAVSREDFLERVAARRAERQARLSLRPADMRDQDYRLPQDVAAFLKALFRPGEVRMPDGRNVYVDVMTMSAELEAAYMEGCRQGYIEGFVMRRAPDKKRSKAGNDGKRRKLLQLPDGRKMTRDKRDAEMVAQYASLLKLPMNKTQACWRLADKYGFDCWQGPAKAIEKFQERHSP